MTATTPPNDLTSIASTICLNCAFADYENNIQTGCKANRLELFKKANLEIKDTQIEDKTCFVLEGKACVYYRNKEWGKEYYKTTDANQILEQVKNELKIPYHVVLFFRKSDSLQDVEKRLSELESQDIKPKIVTLIDRSHGTENQTSKLMKLFSQYSFDHWRVQTIQATDQLDDDIIDLVYDSTKKKPYMFYMIFECKHTIPDVLSNELHRSLHDEMQSFVILLPNNNNVGKAVLKIAHEKYAGNSFGIPLEDKIVHYDDSPHLIKKVEQICPSLHQL